jgi:hypothetical protein
MLRRNHPEPSTGLCNGSFGYVTKITEHEITVKFDHLKEPVQIERVIVEYNIGDQIRQLIAQFPLICADAVTIHKAQVKNYADKYIVFLRESLWII